MNKVYIYKVVYIIIAFLFIINTSTIYMMDNFNVCVAAMAAILIIYNVASIFLYKIKLKKAECFEIMLVTADFLMLFIFWKHVYPYGVYILGILFPNIWLMIKIQREKNKVEEFLKAFVEVNAIVAIYSMIFWIGGSIFGVIKPTAMVPISWGHNMRYIKSYYGLYFEAQNAAIDFGWIRLGVKNNAFFLEAPICAYAFIVAFIINERINLKRKKLIRILFLMMILSTLTTTGILFVACMIVYFESKFHPRNNFEKMLKGFTCTAVIAVAAWMSFSLLRDKVFTYSGSIRVSKMKDEFKAFLNNFLVGNGFNTYTDGSSNSITALLADGGLLLWMVYYIPLLRPLVYNGRKGRWDILLIAYALVFAITVIQYTPICIFMLLLYSETAREGEKINDFDNCSNI